MSSAVSDSTTAPSAWPWREVADEPAAGLGGAGELQGRAGCPRGRRTLSTPPTTRPKNGSAKKRLMNGSSSSLVSASETTRATVPVRRVTSERAARLGT